MKRSIAPEVSLRAHSVRILSGKGVTAANRARIVRENREAVRGLMERKRTPQL